MLTKTGWVFTLTLFYACILAILGLIPNTIGNGSMPGSYPGQEYTTSQTCFNELGLGCGFGTPVNEVFIDATHDQCDALKGTYVPNLQDAITGQNHPNACVVGTRANSFFGNIIRNINDLGWFNAVLFAPLGIVIFWLVLTGFKIAGSGFDGGQ